VEVTNFIGVTNLGSDAFVIEFKPFQMAGLAPSFESSASLMGNCDSVSL
jgi:hypothetical protein